MTRQESTEFSRKDAPHLREGRNTAAHVLMRRARRTDIFYENESEGMIGMEYHDRRR